METHERLVKAIKDAGLTQMAVAEHFGVTPSTVNRWCLGVYKPDEVNARLIEVRFGIPADDWLEPVDRRRLKKFGAGA